MKVRAGAKTDVGRVRQGNEDAYLARDPLFVVADGMGGHLAGEVASATAIELIESNDGVTPENMAEIVERANSAIFSKAKEDSNLSGMGTTCTLVLIQDSTAHIAHVGDSRAYLLRDHRLSQLTEDHTLVARLVREGRITAEEAQHHPQRSIITRALGVDPKVKVDLTSHSLVAGDRILICSDGLSSMLEGSEIQAVLDEQQDPERAADELVTLANEAGGEDNITVVVLDVADTGAGAASPAGTVAAAAPVAATDPLRPRRGVLLVMSLAALLVGALWIGAQYALTNLMWFVGVDTERKVAIFSGIPEEVGGLSLKRLEEPTDLSAEELPEFVRDDVLEGHRVGSLAEARDYVANLRDRAADFRVPSPRPTPTKS